MRIDKEMRRVNIVCQDGSFIRGFVHILPGERVLDFFNDTKKNFIAVTDAEFYVFKEPRSFKLSSKLLAKKSVVILNKSYVKWVEES